MKTHKEYLDKQLSDKKFADRFYREKEELKMDKEYAEKVNAMTDEELLSCASKAMGWFPPESNEQPPEMSYNCDVDGNEWYSLYGIKGRFDAKSVHRKYFWHTEYCEQVMSEGPPDYPRDISAAWELVGSNPDWRWAVYELDSGGWAASPMKVIEVRGEHRLWDHVSEATGETAQRAITKAFILAMEAND